MEAKVERVSGAEISAEAAEWIEAFDDVVVGEGPQAAAELLAALRQRAREAGIPTPGVLTTPYLNTIPKHQELPYLSFSSIFLLKGTGPLRAEAAMPEQRRAALPAGEGAGAELKGWARPGWGGPGWSETGTNRAAANRTRPDGGSHSLKPRRRFASTPGGQRHFSVYR